MLKADGRTSLFLLMILMRVGGVPSCQQTEYEVRGGCCPMCPAGSRVQRDCTELTTTSCVPCAEGTYNEKSNGLKYCKHCSSCYSASGLKVKLDCTLTSDSVCEPQDGFFCYDWSSKSCVAAQKHSSCGAGQFISQRGTASTDTQCSDCSTGTFADGTGTSCQPHRQCEAENLQLIEAGTSSADARCGEQRHNVTGIVIAVLVTVLLVTAGAGLWFWRRKIFGEKLNCLKKRVSGSIFLFGVTVFSDQPVNV
ncbi:hypothetical protein OJAV_G00072250 [Oryzias javanicus]|uniref:TNFR-Cys domain-containing protein n=1 Tax=Oryzias javanicus TaxID=123683 RepID=A0A3S2Q5Z8_ORYJA|nr:hypothetical protein OJAV_G00072250 [Oryzias javanicus]